MKQLIDILHNEELTLVVRSADGELHRFTQRGVKDLLALVTERPKILRDAIIAEGRVKQVHADVMSEPALELLEKHNVTASYSKLVDHIINRTGTDWCPMEKLSRDENDPVVIIEKIKAFFLSKSTN